jgi:hypothetical protein
MNLGHFVTFKREPYYSALLRDDCGYISSIRKIQITAKSKLTTEGISH